MTYLKIYFSELVRLFKENTLIFIQIVAAFLLPIQPLLLLVGLMIVLDTATGIWKAKKTKEKFSSRKLSQTASKILLYELGVVMFYLLERYMLGEFVGIFTSIPFFLTKIVAIFFCTIELISINENIKASYGLNFFQLFKKFLSRASELKKDISKMKED